MEEAAILSLIENKQIPLKRDTDAFLVSARWINIWKRYVQQGHETNSVGTIFWSDLILESDESSCEDPSNRFEFLLKPSLVEGVDYVLLDKNSFDVLNSKYGPIQPLSRRVIEFNNKPEVEVYPLRLKFYSNTNQDKSVFEILFSKLDTLTYAQNLIAKKMSITNTKTVQLYNYWGFKKNEELTLDCDKTLFDLGIDNNQQILIEIEQTTGDLVKRPEKKQERLNYYTSKPTLPGLTGLLNLGNTCFMNSALQVLLHTPELKKYFTEHDFYKDINKKNPIGMKGEIAISFGEIMKDVWSGSYSEIGPRDLKLKLAKYAPQFIGFNQHDSQEFLAFLLDGLHEDLNRVLQKPYIQVPDQDNMLEDLQALEFWNNHKKRNDSIIVDLFQGQLKSCITCPTCNRKVNTFDPFMFLTLPLPTDLYRSITIIVTSNNTLSRVSVKLPRKQTIGELRGEIARITGEDLNKLILADIFDGKIQRYFFNEEPLSEIKPNEDIFCFVVNNYHSNSVTTGYTDKILVPILFRVIKPTSSQRRTTYQYNTVNYICLPLLAQLPRNVTIKDLLHFIFPYIKNFVRKNTEITEENIFQYLSIKICNNQLNVEQDYSDDDVTTNINLSQNMSLVFEWEIKFYKTAYNFEDLMDLPRVSSTHKETSLTLENCLDMFCAPEKLTENNTWYCSKCKEHKQATKKMDIWRTPELLIIHLKRLSNVQGIFREKISTMVEFPNILDMSSHIKSDQKSDQLVYELYGVVNHYGSSLGGHYTSACAQESTFYCFDDSKVSAIPPSEICTEAAYILLYKRLK